MNLNRPLKGNRIQKSLEYISEHLDLKKYYPGIILTTDKTSYLDEVNFNNVRAIINLKRVNNIQHPNKLFRAVNALLPDGGIYIGRLETYAERKELIYSQLGRYLGWIFLDG